MVGPLENYSFDHLSSTLDLELVDGAHEPEDLRWVG